MVPGGTNQSGQIPLVIVGMILLGSQLIAILITSGGLHLRLYLT